MFSQPDAHFFKSKFHRFLPAPTTPSFNPAFLEVQLSCGLILSHAGHYRLCLTAVLDPERHHKGQHPFWIRTGWKEIPASSGGLCPPPGLRSAPWRRHGWDWREGTWDTKGPWRVMGYWRKKVRMVKKYMGVKWLTNFAGHVWNKHQKTRVCTTLCANTSEI